MVRKTFTPRACGQWVRRNLNLLWRTRASRIRSFTIFRESLAYSDCRSLMNSSLGMPDSAMIAFRSPGLISR